MIILAIILGYFYENDIVKPEFLFCFYIRLERIIGSF